MNRERKYRAWVISRSRMVGVGNIPKSFWDIITPIQHDCIIMDWTGRTDNNGVDVYEDDVVNARLCFGPGGSGIRPVVVKWDIETAGYNIGKALEIVSVIGNIHEQPELIYRKETESEL